MACSLRLPAPTAPQLSHRRCGHSRPAVVCSFSFLGKAPQLLFGLQQQHHHQEHEQPSRQQPRHQPNTCVHSLDGFCDQTGAAYSSLMQQAEEITFSMTPASGPHWRESLEEAERMLELCIQERPQHLQPRVLLLRNLLRQSSGREQDVPALALQALQEADLPNAEATMMRHLHVLQIVLLGLKAAYKVQEEGQAASMPAPAGSAQYTPKSFLAAAKAAAPSFGPEFDKLSLKVQRQLVCCSPEQRASLLQDTSGFMSSVDLSAVCGEHHAVLARAGAMSHGGPSVVG